MDSGRPILTPLGDINAIFMHFPFDMVLLQALPDLPQAQTGIFFGINWPYIQRHPAPIRLPSYF